MRKAGVYKYSKDPTTKVLCVGFRVGDTGKIRVVSPQQFLKWYKTLKQPVKLIAHNAVFEILIWNNVCVPKYGWPEISAANFTCTMVMAYAMGLPGSLDNASAAVGIDVGKDQEGHRVMMLLCKPRAFHPHEFSHLEGRFKDEMVPIWYDKETFPEMYQKLYKYCAQDVKVETFIYARLRRLSKYEQNVWILDQKINDRGIGIDIKAAKAAFEIVMTEKERLNEAMYKITDGFVNTCTAGAQLLNWVRSQGFEITSIAKPIISRLLRRGNLPGTMRKALELRAEAARSSNAKIKKMLQVAEKDGRVRGALQYHVATTGRYGGRLIQPHNFTRPKIPQEEIEEVFKILRDESLTCEEKISWVNLVHGPPNEIISSCLRGFIVPKPGNVFIGADFRSIEARVLAWYAGDQDKLNLFKSGKDLYVKAAQDIFGCSEEDVTPERRQIGKIGELSLGFGGGKGAFMQMAKNFNVKGITEEKAEQIKLAWRNTHPKIVALWYAFERGAIAAMQNSGQKFKVHGVMYKKNGSFLTCTLPSGRDICYPYPKLEERDLPWGGKRLGISAKWVNGTSKKWERRHLWHGILVENIVQATARDCLVHSMLALEDANYDIVMHVHDEVLIELQKEIRVLNQVQSIMEDGPQWASGLPLDVECWRGERYQK